MNRTGRKIRSRRPSTLLGVLLGAVALLALAAPASALAAPVLEVDSSHYPSTVGAGSHAQYTLAVSNRGDVDTRGQISVELTLPPELKVVSATDEIERSTGILAIWRCTTAPDASSVNCRAGTVMAGPTPPGAEVCASTLGQSCRIIVMVKADPGAAPGTVVSAIHATGGGSAGPFDDTDPIDIGPPPSFEIRSFDGAVLDENGDPVTQAGSRPHTAWTEFFLTTIVDPTNGKIWATEDLLDTVVRLPPGLVGNPQAYPRCTQAQLLGGGANQVQCPAESQVGVVVLHVNGSYSSPPSTPYISTSPAAVYNMETAKGDPALFGFQIGSSLVQIYARVRTGEDYGVTVFNKNAPQVLPLAGVLFTFWGVPADPAHDAQRYCAGASLPPCTSDAPLRPFLSLPTSCVGPVETFLDVSGWQGGFGSSSFISHDNTTPIPTPIGADGCNAVPFGPSIEARPTTTVADAPSGLDVDLRIPQNEGVCREGPPVRCGTATAHLKDTTVTLPEGLVINPGGANGLDGCSLAEFGYTSTDPDGTIHTTPGAGRCPDASKVATVEVNTPVLDHPVRGSAHVADPFANPFGSLLALYITVDDPQTGIVAKLAGEVQLDPNTGQVSTVFNQNPQLPFENFRLNFFGGAGGALRTPAICGNHTANATLVPWSVTGGGAPVDERDTWQITQGCSNSPAEQPHAPSFDAGAVSPIAGAHSPFVVHLRREDGSQNFSAVTVRPPLGLTAKLAGTPACSDGALAAAAAKSGAGEKASPSCPAASKVGIVDAGAGAGPAPYHAQGKVYLAGPYKGAPISLATIIPATAGPFDLGTVVTRIAAHINPATAEITAVSDQIPSILAGIPLNVKTVDVALDKPQFSLNPTNCDPMAVTGQLLSTIGQLANLSSRFQLGECDNLGFKPRMALRLRGGTKRGKHPQLSAYVLPRPGDANIRSVSVAFPRSEFLENAHIRTICTRPDFAADRCPAGAVYGTSTVYTPLLDYPLSGNVYLRSSDNLLPDIVPDLRGPAHQPIKVEAAGRTDSIRGGIRNTFDFFPDAPFTRAVLRMQGGDKGLLVNSRNICARTYRAKVRFLAHNGATHTIRPKLKAQNCKKKRKARRRAHKRTKRGGKRSALAARASAR